MWTDAYKNTQEAKGNVHPTYKQIPAALCFGHRQKILFPEHLCARHVTPTLMTTRQRERGGTWRAGRSLFLRHSASKYQKLDEIQFHLAPKLCSFPSVTFGPLFSQTGNWGHSGNTISQIPKRYAALDRESTCISGYGHAVIFILPDCESHSCIEES